LADTGESEVFYHKDWDALDVLTSDLAKGDDLQPFVDYTTGIYAATDEKRDAAAESAAGDALKQSRGIEVGQVFYFGDKYTKAMGVTITGADGSPVTPLMGSYGIGVSRLMGAIIEASHDKDGIIWPEAVAPYKVALINLRVDDAACTSAADDLYARLTTAGVEVLYDDRDERGGAKFATADLIGLPWQLVIGPKGLAMGVVELKRRGGEKSEVGLEAALARLIA
jgi:prolyl-tRNA synthetase